MDLLVQNATLYTPEGLAEGDVLVQNGKIAAIGKGLGAEGAEVFDATGCLVSPGFTDLHVHLREPGFTDKETIATGTAAAAAGGFTTVCAMPNLTPVPDSLHNLEPQLKAIEKDACICVLPYGALTVGEKGDCAADIEILAPSVAGFTDDGVGVQDEAMMRRVMATVAENDAMVAAHCELESLLPKNGTCVQEGSAFAARHGFTGYSEESEAAEVERDIRLAADTGCRLHICHTSTSRSLDLVREAKARGEAVTCEVTPHNLLLSCEDIQEDDGRFKMNPPLRTPQSRDAAVQALRDGTADAIATDHAPHTPAQKAGGFAKSMNGVVGLETAFAAVYTGLVKTGRVSLERVLEALTGGPRRVLKTEDNPLAVGAPADLVVLDLQTERPVEPDRFLSKGRSSPFAGKALQGWPVLTLAAGEVVYDRRV